MDVNMGIQDDYEKLTSFWNQASIDDPYWFVATKLQFRRDRLSFDEFYADAKDDMQPLLETIQACCEWVPGDGRCLEFGCGAGRGTVHLARCFRDVLAYDAIDNYVSITRNAIERLGIRNVTVSKSGIEIPPPSEPIDLAYSVLVFQHMVPRMVVHYLSQLCTYLRPGGLLYFQCLTEPEEAPEAVAGTNGHSLCGTSLSMITSVLNDGGVDIVREVLAQEYTGNHGRSVIIVAKKRSSLV